MPSKVATCVKTFMPIMAPKVEARTKLQTVRKWPKRLPKVGQRFSGRAWTGRPRRSKQRILVEGEVVDVREVYISADLVYFPKWRDLRGDDYLEFAKADGFDTIEDFHAWFLKDGPVFHGVFINWKPDV